MYLRKIKPSTTCLYSAASIFLRSLSATLKSCCSNVLCISDVGLLNYFLVWVSELQPAFCRAGSTYFEVISCSDRFLSDITNYLLSIRAAAVLMIWLVCIIYNLFYCCRGGQGR